MMQHSIRTSRPTGTPGWRLGATLALGAVLGLSACDDAAMPGFLSGDGVSDTAASESEATRRDGSFVQPEGEPQSETITTLLARQTLLQAGSTYDAVAQAALVSSRRAAEADLRAAKLRAEAKSKNWLPTLTPGVSLISLSELAANILIEQVLFDNGRRKAERAFAAADVEVAAVNLSIDLNERVETALKLYVTGLQGDEKAALYTRALSRMAEFERVVRGRVRGGISDRSDLRVVTAKIDDITVARANAQEAASSARAELTAMTGQEFDRGFEPLTLGTPPSEARHLSVLVAEAEGERGIAQAAMDRAGLLPGVTASGVLTESGGTDGSITLDSNQPIGFGTPAALKATKAAKETASRRVAEADEEARRAMARQKQRLASYRRIETESAKLAQQSRETFRLFQAQFKAGQRSIMDVASIYEELVQREQDHVDAKYQVVLTQLEMARDRGLLANGEEI